MSASKKPPYSWLGLHVARLAHADQIGSSVGIGRIGEVTERLYVMDGEAVPDVFPALRAAAPLFAYNNSAGCPPSTPTVSGGAADPIGGLFPRDVRSPIRALAAKPTEFQRGAASPELKRPTVKLLAAVVAANRHLRSISGVGTSLHNGRPGVFLWASADGVHAPDVHRAKAGLGAEPRLIGTECIDRKYGSAFFARNRWPFGRLGVAYGRRGTSTRAVLSTVCRPEWADVECFAATSAGDHWHKPIIRRFAGSGTTILVTALARDRVRGDAPLFVEVAESLLVQAAARS